VWVCVCVGCWVPLLLVVLVLVCVRCSCGLVCGVHIGAAFVDKHYTHACCDAVVRAMGWPQLAAGWSAPASHVALLLAFGMYLLRWCEASCMGLSGVPQGPRWCVVCGVWLVCGEVVAAAPSTLPPLPPEPTCCTGLPGPLAAGRLKAACLD
jgi:hypothetical protein